MADSKKIQLDPAKDAPVPEVPAPAEPAFSPPRNPAFPVEMLRPSESAPRSKPGTRTMIMPAPEFPEKYVPVVPPKPAAVIATPIATPTPDHGAPTLFEPPPEAEAEELFVPASTTGQHEPGALTLIQSAPDFIAEQARISSELAEKDKRKKKIAEAAKDFEAAHPVKPAKAAEPVKPIEALGTADLVKTVEPVKPVELLEPSKPDEVPEPVKPVESLKPADVPEPVKPLEIPEPVKPVESVEPAPHVEAAAPVLPPDFIEPAKPVEISEPVSPVEALKLADVLEPAKPLEIPEPVQRVEAVEPAMPVEILEPLKPSGLFESDLRVDAAELSHALEASATSAPVAVSEAPQNSTTNDQAPANKFDAWETRVEPFEGSWPAAAAASAPAPVEETKLVQPPESVSTPPAPIIPDPVPAPAPAKTEVAPLAPAADNPFGDTGSSSSVNFSLPQQSSILKMPAASGLNWRKMLNEIPTEKPKAVLIASGLMKWFGKRQVVRGVDVEVGAGEIVGLLGRNGAGKTTTFRMIMGLLHPDGGTVTYEKRDVTRLPMYERANRGIGYLAQQPSIFQKLSVEENLMAVLELQEPSRKIRLQRMDELIASLGLEKVRHSQSAVLSGGERRRLEIARAMSLRPRVVLFDEPFAGIDPITVNEIQGILKDLKKQGVGVLLTDHNVRETLAITDRTYIMDEGKIWIHGHPREIVANEEARSRYLGHEFRLDF